ncbi:MAG: TetR/AcrR family transcriptional regulator [Ktedonobacterales bacterium]
MSSTFASRSAGSQSLKERQRQEREQLILQAAEALLVEHGYHETSIDEIAARVGISKGTVYLHFASKEEMVFALLRCEMTRFQQALDDILAARGSPAEQLRAVLTHVYTGGTGGLERHAQLMGAIFRDPDLRNRLLENREAMHATWDTFSARLSALIEAGKAAGEIDAALPTPVILSIFGALMAPPTYSRLITRDGLAPEQVVAHLSRIFFKGIAPETA